MLNSAHPHAPRLPAQEDDWAGRELPAAAVAVHEAIQAAMRDLAATETSVKQSVTRLTKALPRRKLERTSGALDDEIGLLAPSEAERRTVIGVTARYRPETAKRESARSGCRRARRAGQATFDSRLRRR
jgi:hypothetical protein